MRRPLVLMFIAIALEAKELLDTAVLNTFLTESNPFVYTAVAQQYVSQARAEAAKGSFDTRLGAKYDNKRYPTSTGEFADIFIEKPTESGIAFLAGYRKAEGVQEYNNIKTGDDGELRVGVKVPVFAVVEGVNERTFRYRSAALDARRSGSDALDNLRKLRFDVFHAYYVLLYRHETVALASQLLQRAQERLAFVQTKVQAGEIPQIEQLEARRQLLDREQRLLDAQNAYGIALTALLRYLGLTPQVFDQRFALPPLPMDAPAELTYADALQQAYARRPDLASLRYETRRLELSNEYIAVQQYPRFNVALYGVHDFQYDNGVKISVDMDFPLERRVYHGQKREVAKRRRAVEEVLRVKRIEIETGLSNRFNTVHILKRNIEKAQQEVAVARQLASAERKRFSLGAGELMMVNLRELATLEAQMKRLEYAFSLQREVLAIARDSASFVQGAGDDLSLKR